MKNAQTRSIFKLEKCSFFLNGSEFCHILISTIISVHSASNNDKAPYEVKCHIRAKCAPLPLLPEICLTYTGIL